MYIIEYNDGDSLCIPMTWDDECAGAVCSGASSSPVAIFPDRAAARRAIDISAKFAALCKAQGKPANDDFFPPCRKNVRIRACKPNVAIDRQDVGGGR